MLNSGRNKTPKEKNKEEINGASRIQYITSNIVQHNAYSDVSHCAVAVSGVMFLYLYIATNNVPLLTLATFSGLGISPWTYYIHFNFTSYSSIRI